MEVELDLAAVAGSGTGDGAADNVFLDGTAGDDVVVGVTQLLWETYHPQYIWIPFALVGALAAVGLWIFGRMAKRWADMNA